MPFDLTQLAAAMAVPPTPAMRRSLACASLRVAVEAVREGDLAAARVFIDDALMQLQEASKCSSD